LYFEFVEYSVEVNSIVDKMRALFLSIIAVCFLAFVNCESNGTATTTTVKPSPETTTTEKPSNVTTSKPTEPPTTPMPEPPKPDPTPLVNYTIVTKDAKTHKDIICLMAEFSAKIELTYNNSKTGKPETGYVSLTNHSVVDEKQSNCSENETVLVIKINGVESDTLKLTVEKKDNKYFVREVVLDISEKSIIDRIPLAPSVDMITASMNQTMFEAPVGKSYICKSANDMKMSSPSDSKFSVKLDVSDVRFDAFRKEEGHSWRDGQLCAQDEEFSDIIPIAVGAALAALVVIVLIAYFIGRRRSRRLAYQSV